MQIYYCAHCQNRIPQNEAQDGRISTDEGAKVYCHSCADELNLELDCNQSAAAPAVRPAVRRTNRNASSRPVQAAPDPKASSEKMIIISLVAGIIILAIIAVVLLMTGKKPPVQSAPIVKAEPDTVPAQPKPAPAPPAPAPVPVPQPEPAVVVPQPVLQPMPEPPPRVRPSVGEWVEYFSRDRMPDYRVIKGDPRITWTSEKGLEIIPDSCVVGFDKRTLKDCEVQFDFINTGERRYWEFSIGDFEQRTMFAMPRNSNAEWVTCTAVYKDGKFKARFSKMGFSVKTGDYKGSGFPQFYITESDVPVYIRNLRVRDLY